MKTKFKETIEKCDSLEHRLNDLVKEKQSVERKYVLCVVFILKKPKSCAVKLHWVQWQVGVPKSFFLDACPF